MTSTHPLDAIPDPMEPVGPLRPPTIEEVVKSPLELSHARLIGVLEGVVAAITTHGNSPWLNRILVTEHLDLLVSALAAARRVK